MNIFEIKVHPAADIFPMIPKDELEELAADIKANGLIHPIVVKDGILIDGRNRRAACEIAGVEPEVVELNGEDINAYIISSNINRRHMTMGQKAIAIAMIYPTPENGVKGKKGILSIPFSKQYLSHARTVLRHLPDLADSVLAGTPSLKKAYQQAIDARDDAKSEEDKLEELRSVAPDLVEDVIQGEKDLETAVEEFESREEEARVDRLGWWKILKDLDTNRMVLNDSSIEEIALAYSEYPKESGVDIVALAEWYGGIFESLLEKINENSSNS